METAKIANQKKIGMANPLVQKIGNVKMWSRDIEQLEIEES